MGLEETATPYLEYERYLTRHRRAAIAAHTPVQLGPVGRIEFDAIGGIAINVSFR